MKRKLILSVVLLTVSISVLFAFRNGKTLSSENSADYTITKKWELPQVLEEVSAIEWIGEDLLAAIQDEDGIIFIYNLKSSEIEEEIPFAGGGDYEGLRINGENAYVLRSDGLIFEILDFRSEKRKVIKHPTELTKIEKIDMEGLSYNPETSGLLLVTKDRQDGEMYKDVYSLDLKSNKLQVDAPYFRIELSDPIFEQLKGDEKDRFTPSEMEKNPLTGKFYFLDGKNPKLLITDAKAKPEALYLLKKKDFSQPEGLTFSPDGKLYISNEADKKKAANILLVQLRE